jgi:hypothetical protein
VAVLIALLYGSSLIGMHSGSVSSSSGTAVESNAETMYRQSCTTVSLKVLDRDAASLKGHRYRFTGDVFDLEFSSAQDYWGISPPGLDTQTNLFIGVIDHGYGPWKESIGVVFDQRVTQIHNDDTVTIWGTCAGFCTFKSDAGKRVTLPLIHAKYVTVD